MYCKVPWYLCFCHTSSVKEAVESMAKNKKHTSTNCIIINCHVQVFKTRLLLSKFYWLHGQWCLLYSKLQNKITSNSIVKCYQMWLIVQLNLPDDSTLRYHKSNWLLFISWTLQHYYCTCPVYCYCLGALKCKVSIILHKFFLMLGWMGCADRSKNSINNYHACALKPLPETLPKVFKCLLHATNKLWR